MNILHVAPSIARQYGGPTQSTAAYARAARGAGLTVTVVAPRCDDLDAADFAARADASDVKLFRSSGAGAFVAAPGLIAWVLKNARRYDVIHVHGLFNPVSSFSARVALHRGAAVIIRPFGTLSRYTFAHRRTFLKSPYFRWVDRPNIDRSAAVHFTSEMEAAEAEWHNLRLGARAKVIAPPFVPDAASKGMSIGESRPPTVIVLSRLHPVKNIEALLNAWPLVMKRVPDARLVVAGSGQVSYVQQLRSLADNLGLNASVSFVGFVSGDAKWQLLSQGRLFVLPSLHENFGTVVLEAVSAGLPVIITPEVQLAPFVRRYGLGAVTSSEPSLLSSAIVSALLDDALLHHVASAGLKCITDNFAPDAVGASLTSMYQDALRTASARRK